MNLCVNVYVNVQERETGNSMRNQVHFQNNTPCKLSTNESKILMMNTLKADKIWESQ